MPKIAVGDLKGLATKGNIVTIQIDLDLGEHESEKGFVMNDSFVTRFTGIPHADLPGLCVAMNLMRFKPRTYNKK